MLLIAAGALVIVLAVAWLRYADRFDSWTTAKASRLGLRHQAAQRPQWYRVVHVWGGATLLAALGLLLLVAGFINVT